MLRSKLQKLWIYAFPICVLGAPVHAADPRNPAVSSTEEAPEGRVEASSSPKVPTRAEHDASRFVISSGFGFIRAYGAPKKKSLGLSGVGKRSLGASGLADVKLSYMLRSIPGQPEQRTYLTLRYLPFYIAPNTSVDGVDQEYEGIVNALAAGGEFKFLSKAKWDLYASAELAIYQARLTELIPVTESSPPIKRIGGLVIAGAELRYKPMENFHFGPRIHLATGNIVFTSLLLTGSFYF
jgi:hypothetical protein